MDRFMGLMPSNEVKVRRNYIDKNKLHLTIEAGDNGYTIIFADKSTMYQDICDTTENNFKLAYDRATKKLGELYELDY